MTLHRFLEPFKNQFTHFGYEEKAATQATQSLGQWGVVPNLRELLLGHTLQAPPRPSLTHPLLNTAPSCFYSLLRASPFLS